MTDNNIIKGQLIKEQIAHEELALTQPNIKNSQINNEVIGLQNSSGIRKSSFSVIIL